MRTERGYTLLEMLVVVSILAGAAGLAAGALGSGGAAGRDLAHDRVVALLRHARIDAQASGAPVAVSLGQIAHAAGGATPRETEGQAVRWVPQRSALGGEAAVVYYPDGSVSSGRLEFRGTGGARVLHVHWSGTLDETP